MGHGGIGVGRVSCFRVGSIERKEMLLSGPPLHQAFGAEHAAAKGEVLCSAEVRALVAGSDARRRLELVLADLNTDCPGP